MRDLRTLFFLGLAIALVAALLGLSASVTGRQQDSLAHLSDLNAMERKTGFFEALLPAIRAKNAEVRDQRATLEEVRRRVTARPFFAAYDKMIVDRLAQQYRLPDWQDDPEESLQILRRRIDVIPADLALVQAAKESGWGQSRFAREANNLFGEWCYEPGCGIVPAARGAQQRHEVERFSDLEGSISSYIDNLNSHPSYATLRQTRAALRRSGDEPTGLDLVGGLIRYSQRRGAYVSEVRDMLRSNGTLIATVREAN